MDQNNGIQKAFGLVRACFFFATMTASFLFATETDYSALMDELSAKNNKTAVDYYNMGVCAHQLNKPYESAVFWNYARSQADPELGRIIDDAIREAQSSTVQFESTGLLDFARSIPALPIQLLALISGLLLIGVAFHAPRFLLYAWIIFLMSLCCAVCVYFVHATHRAIVAAPVDLRVGPGQNYMKSLQLSQGATVAILEQHKSWCKIQSSNQKGWVERHRLIRI